jgi:hypothetical protein
MIRFEIASPRPVSLLLRNRGVRLHELLEQLGLVRRRNPLASVADG